MYAIVCEQNVGQFVPPCKTEAHAAWHIGKSLIGLGFGLCYAPLVVGSPFHGVTMQMTVFFYIIPPLLVGGYNIELQAHDVYAQVVDTHLRLLGTLAALFFDGLFLQFQ